MLAESTHALAPLFVSFVVLIVSFASERFALSRVERYLEFHYQGNANLRDAISKLAEGVLILTGFLVNALLFIANCFIALFIYPIASHSVLLSLVAVDFVILSLLVIEIVWLLTTMEIIDIAEYTVNRGRWTLRKVLKYEQIAFVLSAFLLFFVGFGLQH